MTSNRREQKKTKKKISKQKPKIDFSNWNTSDADEIERRKARAELEKFNIQNLEPSQAYYSDFMVGSKADKKYHVEIRSLQEHSNSCNCPDYRTNGLGTCKHIEFVLNRLKKKGVRLFKQAAEKKSHRIEVYLKPTGGKPIISIQWPAKYPVAAKNLLDGFFSSDGSLLDDIIATYESFLSVMREHSRKLKKIVRVSKHIDYFFEYQKVNAQKETSRKIFMKDLETGKRYLSVVKSTLYPYQEEGVLHLAFTERALLADEMGLGKTIQAIAACELLKQTRQIQRVLIVTTASLKAEWEEQIHKFTGSPVHLIYGSRGARLKQYNQSSFFYVMNYEQVVVDYEEIQHMLAPDVVILDEAQRIKNWQTKTANKVKELKSRYAFVLTGTPVENRIDDIYSIVQFLDPHVFGSLFRFNRDFYALDEQGKPVGYKNLDELYRRLRAVMLCRKKSDVEDELPSRTVNNYFVRMDLEQQKRYDGYESHVVRIVQRAKQRALRKEEFEQLQKWLACMRMICDTPYILDKKCQISPKLDELKTILEELMADETTKIIIFSEWERMLQLVKEVAHKQGWEAAWHTGSVNQKKRREDIKNFKENKACRLFLSTDAGSVGLNLQVANVVINLDLPWNPAKLEQRIARAWRKHQTRSVQVINLISENSIEHRMLYLLEQKQLMAKGVLTGDAELKEMKMPSGRAAFMERMEALMGDISESFTSSHQNTDTDEKETSIDNVEKINSTIIDEVGDELNLLQSYQSNDQSPPVILAVLNEELEEAKKKIASVLKDESISIETIDQRTLEIIQRLAKAGILTLNTPTIISHDHTSEEIKKQRRKKQFDQVAHYLNQAERKHRMARVLIESDFTGEAILPLRDALTQTVKAFFHLTDERSSDELSLSHIETLISKHKGPNKMPFLFSELIISKKEEIDVKKLHQDHQITMSHLVKMKEELEQK